MSRDEHERRDDQGWKTHMEGLIHSWAQGYGAEWEEMGDTIGENLISMSQL